MRASGWTWLFAQPGTFAATTAPPPFCSLADLKPAWPEQHLLVALFSLEPNSGKDTLLALAFIVVLAVRGGNWEVRGWLIYGLTAIRSSFVVPLHLLAVSPVWQMVFLLHFPAFCEGVNNFLPKLLRFILLLKKRALVETWSVGKLRSESLCCLVPRWSWCLCLLVFLALPDPLPRRKQMFTSFLLSNPK